MRGLFCQPLLRLEPPRAAPSRPESPRNAPSRPESHRVGPDRPEPPRASPIGAPSRLESPRNAPKRPKPPLVKKGDFLEGTRRGRRPAQLVQGRFNRVKSCVPG